MAAQGKQLSVLCDCERVLAGEVWTEWVPRRVDMRILQGIVRMRGYTRTRKRKTELSRGPGVEGYLGRKAVKQLRSGG